MIASGGSPASSEAILTGLNPAQREAVLTTEGPLLVLAGAGSGKTRVIAHRIAYLLGARGLDPRHVLAVTFTNKAAEEMARRVEALLAPWGLRPPLVATFHATCVRILRAEIHHLGEPRGFLIYDEEDQLTVVKEVLRDLGWDERTVPPASLLHRISRAKGQLLTPEAYAAQAYGPREAEAARVFARYEERLRAAHALDFDDLLLRVVRLWERHPEVLARYRRLWRYVLIDEYQDTNHAQYRLVRLLTAEHRNLCVVGDPDQSVYRWRGADIRNILDFERDYPDCRVVRLEQNYRSTRRILAIASDLITRNLGRKPKALWTENVEGDRAACYRAWDEEGEAAFVARTVAGLAEEGFGYEAVAVFYRTNAQSRVLEEALLRRGIPYRIVGGVRFYARREVKDVLAWLRLLATPTDDLAFRRAIGAPPRGIGKTTLARLEALAVEEGRSLLDAAERLAADPATKAARALGGFVAGLRGLRARAGALPLGELVRELLEVSGYRAALERERTGEAEGRLANLEELAAAAETFEAHQGGGLPAFLDSVALLSGIDELPEGRGAVTLMTLHSAKGLEFPVVFMTGMEEGTCPHVKSLDDPEALEEERRLAYVGLTRAKRRLYLSYALRRRLHGWGRATEPSRFLLELPEEELVLVNGRPPAPAAAPVVPEATETDLPYGVGARVRHPRWGEGLVVRIERDGGEVIVTVNFRTAGQRRLALSHAPLEEV
ncbi:MAG: UvrD-helicase domain-containing protein [Candidatus Rokubacteria bacterium]|nr:UvrD-helicase domain-containing protein [Candidatus Rokubacteria bacterium]MBI2879235.1 UvrD-helicase domain-containing protein [Candidatus Rokubacteria bacterium]